MKRLILVLLSLALFYTTAAYAQQVNVNAADMLIHLSRSMPNLMRLVTAIAYVMGFVFVLKGIMGLKHVGEARTQMSKEHELKGPLIFIFVGAALIYLPTTIQTGLSTFWEVTNPYAYVTRDGDSWADLTNAIFMLVQVVGVIAFIRGLVLLTHIGGHAQPGTFGRAITHMIAGILLINLYNFINVVLATFGITITS